MNNISIGSVCSGIEAASVALNDPAFNIQWFSEIDSFPSNLLSVKYPNIQNIGNMNGLPGLIKNKQVDSPDMICGGTPCQAFSLAGWKEGLADDRGNLTLKFVEIIKSNDLIRLDKKMRSTIVLWENVEGVLNDKTNAFGCFLSSLIGLDSEIKMLKWPKSGLLRGPKRNVAWRVLDSKYFGLPQQRRRLYLLSGGNDFFPENILFDDLPEKFIDYKETNQPISFKKNKQDIEVFRHYTDCLYSAYGTKWNGNAAAYNGSLFVAQNGRLRRMTPIECERLMGFPDNYTDIAEAKSTNRYQSLGNSWSIPVISWIGKRLLDKHNYSQSRINKKYHSYKVNLKNPSPDTKMFLIPSSTKFEQLDMFSEKDLNGSPIPNDYKLGKIKDIIFTNADEKYYISPVGCKGILRRAEERGININLRLKYYLRFIASKMSDKDIEKISRIQPRGSYINNS